MPKLTLDILGVKLEDIKCDVQEIKTKLESNYATKEWVTSEYGQTKKIVNGLVGTIITAVLLALIGLVVIK